MPFAQPWPDLKKEILDLLAENRFMTVATIRPDGWPQATIVGYANVDLQLYFAVGDDSQKLANITREPRVSIALGHNGDERIRGLSMAAHAAVVREQDEIDRIIQIVRDRHPNMTTFTPRTAGALLLRATPVIVSVIDLPVLPGRPLLVKVKNDLSVEPFTFAPGQPDAGGPFI